jgi:predicted ATP-dependent serine protease
MHGITLENLIASEEDNNQLLLFPTGMTFLDDVLGGGFQEGQIVTITGDTEAGKTQMLNQILAKIGNTNKCLYFSLEFSKSQLKKLIQKKTENGTISKKALKNIKVFTNEMVDGEIAEIEQIMISQIKSHDITHIGIDSTLMLYHQNYTGEQEITEIFRILHSVAIKFNVTIFVITQGTKQDNRDNRVSIFGSQKANHFPLVMLHLFYNKKKNYRQLIVAKNKQTGIYAEIDIYLDKYLLSFEELGKTASSASSSGNDKDETDASRPANKTKSVMDLL